MDLVTALQLEEGELLTLTFTPLAVVDPQLLLLELPKLKA